MTFTLDPMGHYKLDKSKVYPKWPQRYFNSSLLRNADYDTVVLGSSMAENFLSSDINELLGVKSVQLSLSGATPYDLKTIFELSKSYQVPNKVLYCLGVHRFNSEISEHRKEFPLYLYDKSILNDYKYLFNKDILFVGGLKKKFNSYDWCDSYRFDFNKLYYWADKSTFSKAAVVNHYKKLLKKSDNYIYDYDLKKMKLNLKQNLVKLIEGNKNTIFTVIIPPFSLYWFKFLDDKGKLDEFMLFRKIYAEELVKYDNVELYDFQAEKFINDLDRYKDITHYDNMINYYMLESISKGRNRVQCVSQLIANNKTIRNYLIDEY